jgi:outer membrane protein insertion porin family
MVVFGTVLALAWAVPAAAQDAPISEPVEETSTSDETDSVSSTPTPETDDEVPAKTSVAPESPGDSSLEPDDVTGDDIVPELDPSLEAEVSDAAEDDVATTPAERERARARRQRELADRDLIGKPIRRVTFSCDLPVCENPEQNEIFVELSGLRVGTPYTIERMISAEERLAKTGFFSKFQVRKELDNGSVNIAIEASGAVLVRQVDFVGLEAPPFESDLRKILTYRQGEAFTRDRARATAQLESLQNMFEREGFFGTKIAMIVREVEDQPFLVDLVFKVEKGEPRIVCDVGLRGLRALTYAEARDLVLADISFLERRLSFLDLPYTKRSFKAGQDALLKAYRERGFFEARITEKAATYDKNQDCMLLALDINEGPRWDLEFRGNDAFSDKELREVLPFFESGYVDDEEISRAERAIERLYQTRGYPFSRVSGEETRRDELDRLISFAIQEGPRLEIEDVAITGNDAIDTAALTVDFGTRSYGIFETGGFLQTEQLMADIARVEEKYREQGYLTATVPRYWVDIDGDQILVTIEVDEGERVEVERVDVRGNRVAPEGTLLDGLSTLQNKPFVPFRLKADRTKISQRYATYGYPLMELKTTCKLLDGNPVACEAPRLPRGCLARTGEEIAPRCEWTNDGTRYQCQRRDPATACTFEGGVVDDRVLVEHVVAEGPRVIVGPRLLKGNFDTRTSVIWREVLLNRGDLLDTNKVITSQGNLRSLNIFDSVSIETIGLDDAAREQNTTSAALLLNVEEGDTRFVDLKFGLELRELLSDQRQLLLTGEAIYADRNLFGFAQGLQPHVIGAIDTFDLIRLGADTAGGDATELTTLDFLLGAEVIYSHPRFMKSLFGIEQLNLSVSPFYLLDLVGVVIQQVLREEWGLRADLRKEVLDWFDRVYLQFGVEFKQIATFEPGDPVFEGVRVFSPRRTVGKLSPEIALDGRDSPLNPTDGYLLRLNPEFVSGDALGTGGEEFLGDSYLRLQVGFSYYIDLWRNLVWGQSIRFGQIFPFAGRENPVPAEERFYLGGVRSVRGFEDNSIGPINPTTQTATGGEFMMNYNAELRYPLLGDFGVYGATFIDAGVLADCRVDDFDDRRCYGDAFGGDITETIRLAGGIGLRALILDQIPVVIDYGIILNRQAGEKFGQVHANVGYTFD